MAPVQVQKIEADLIDHTIDTLSVIKLREIFKTICKTCPEGKKKRTEELLFAKKQDAKPVPPASEDGQEATDASTKDETAKQPVPRYAICKNCEKEFDVTTNTSTNCQYHTSKIPS